MSITRLACKRGLRVALVIAALLPLPLAAQTITEGSYAKETLPVSTASVPFTVATYTPSGIRQPVQVATFTIEGCAVRVWTTGDAPTSTTGLKLNAGEAWKVITTKDIQNFRAIRDTSCAVDATLQVIYSR
jgi:hypothetical protein